MHKGWTAILFSFWLIGVPEARAQNLVDWLKPEQERVAVVANANDHRQVRFTGGWETADYVMFEWRDLRGEMVYLTANDDSVSINFPLTASEIPRLFRAASHGEVMLGKSGRGSFLLGTAFGQRFTIADSTLNCFTFLSSDPQRVLYGYACAATEPSRARIEDFLRDVQFVDGGFREGDASLVSAIDTEAARQFALGRDNPVGAQGLTEVPLGYAVLNPIGGG